MVLVAILEKTYRFSTVSDIEDYRVILKSYAYVITAGVHGILEWYYSVLYPNETLIPAEFRRGTRNSRIEISRKLPINVEF